MVRRACSSLMSALELAVARGRHGSVRVGGHRRAPAGGLRRMRSVSRLTTMQTPRIQKLSA